jgi:hypothetical protein
MGFKKIIFAISNGRQGELFKNAKNFIVLHVIFWQNIKLHLKILFFKITHFKSSIFKLHLNPDVIKNRETMKFVRRTGEVRQGHRVPPFLVIKKEKRK